MINEMTDRLLFPSAGFTLGHAIDYYRNVARWLLPHLRNVPVSIKRYPGTIDEESFWEKDAPSFTPRWVKTIAVPRRSGESDIDYIVIDDRKTLLWVVATGGIEIHPFLHRAPHIERATSIVFDLDPGRGATMADCCEVALILRDALARLGLESLAKTSGSKGLQIYVALNGNDSHETTELFARLLAEELARRHPKRIVAKMDKQLRARKVFIDWSQNADYKTTVSVYSLRTKRDRPFVSMPVTWEEVEAAGDLDFAPVKALARLRARGDLFKQVLTLKQSLPIGRGVAESRGSRARSRPSKKRTQSGRRLFLFVKTEQAGDELWLESNGMLERWILRPDREGGRRLIAVRAGEFGIDPANYTGATIRERGTYELIEAGHERRRLFFSGELLDGEWLLRKIEPGAEHRSWALEPSSPAARKRSASSRTPGRGSAASRGASTDSARRRRSRASAGAGTAARKRRKPPGGRSRSRRPRN